MFWSTIYVLFYKLNYLFKMWHITLTIHFRCDVLYIDFLFEELTCYSVHNYGKKPVMSVQSGQKIAQ